MPQLLDRSTTYVPEPAVICSRIFASQQQVGEEHDIWRHLEDCGIWNNPSMLNTSADPVIRLLQVYSVSAEESAEIGTYLRDNPDILLVLEEAPDHIREFFPSSNLNIEMFTDPESESTELAVVIQYDGEPESTTERLLEFSRKWWGKVARPLAGRMMVCLE